MQTVSGTLEVNGKRTSVTLGRMRGDRIVFTAGGSEYTGRVTGETMHGQVRGMTAGAWRATRSDL